MAKDGDSAYVSRRTRDRLKLKCTSQPEFVIGGYTEPHGRRMDLGALLIGFYHRGKLIYACKVGTGFDAATLARLGRKLAQLETLRSPFASDGLPRRGVHWVNRSSSPKLPSWNGRPNTSCGILGTSACGTISDPRRWCGRTESVPPSTHTIYRSQLP